MSRLLLLPPYQPGNVPSQPLAGQVIVATGSGNRVKGGPYAPTVLTLTSPVNVTNNAVLANVAGMSLALVPGNYLLQLQLHFSTNGGAVGYRWGWSSSGGLTYGGAHAMVGIALANGSPALFNFDPSTGTGNTQAAVTVSDDVVFAEGAFTVTVAGTIQLQFAQGTSSGTASTLLAGSSVIIMRLA